MYDTWQSVEGGRNYIHGMLEFIIYLFDLLKIFFV